jgi:hypothetical protein
MFKAFVKVVGVDCMHAGNIINVKSLRLKNKLSSKDQAVSVERHGALFRLYEAGFILNYHASEKLSFLSFFDPFLLYNG